MAAWEICVKRIFEEVFKNAVVFDVSSRIINVKTTPVSLGLSRGGLLGWISLVFGTAFLYRWRFCGGRGGSALRNEDVLSALSALGFILSRGWPGKTCHITEMLNKPAEVHSHPKDVVTCPESPSLVIALV